MNTVLIIPDIFNTSDSGALAAKDLAYILKDLNCEVGIFTLKADINKEDPDFNYFPRTNFRAKSNYFSSVYKEELSDAISKFKPNIVFSIGGITNRPLIYLDTIKKLKVKHAYLIFCQDFYCARIHAALADGPCFLCLEKSYLYSFINNCSTRSKRNGYLYLINSFITKYRLKHKLAKVDCVYGSSQEQLSMYEKYGISKERIHYLPLFFPKSRLAIENTVLGDYFVIAGQNRIEKGAHLIAPILDHLKPGVKIKMAFSREKEGKKCILHYGLQKYIDNGILEPIYNVSWDSGLKELYNNACGVIITSIWPSTTEFAFLEALGLSKPIITFDVGIHSELIENYENGFKVKLNDFQNFAYFINCLNEDKDLARKISKASRALFEHLVSKEQFSTILSKTILN